MIKNIIFDWSGTLSDDLNQVHKAVMNVFKILGLKTISLEEYKKEFTLPYINFYRKFGVTASKEELDKLFIKEINLVGEPKPFPKSKEVLNFFRDKGIKMSLLSSHPQEKLEKEIKDYGFQKFFLDIAGGVNDKVETILEILKKNGFNPNETAYVGDAEHDIHAGKKAKVLTIAVSWGYRPKDKLLNEKPDFFIENLTDLKNII